MIRFARSSLASLTLSTALSFAQTTPRFARAGADLRQIMKSGPFRNARTSMLARSATSRIEPGFHQYRRPARFLALGRLAGVQKIAIRLHRGLTLFSRESRKGEKQD